MGKKIVVHYKTSNSLVEEIKKREDIEIFKKPLAISKLFKKSSFPDLFFHSGALDKESINYINNSKFTITNSFSNLNLIKQMTNIDDSKIDVIYPSANIIYTKEKSLRKKYEDEFSLSINTKIVLFYANNFKTSGIKEFLEIASNLSYIDVKLIIVGAKQQLQYLEFLLPKFPELQEKIIKKDIKDINIDEIYSISDIFLLPTHSKNIASNVIKAMFCKCVVFSTVNNDIKEIIDIFATMDRPNDPSTPFKIDAVLYDVNELKNIKRQNRKIAKELSLKRNIDKFNTIIDKI